MDDFYDTHGAHSNSQKRGTERERERERQAAIVKFSALYLSLSCLVGQ